MTDMKVHLQMNDAENAVPMITMAADVSESPMRIEVVVQGFEPGPEGARAVAEALQATAEALLVELGLLGSDTKASGGSVFNPAAPHPGADAPRPERFGMSINPSISGFATPQHVLDARAARAEARTRRRFNPK